MYIYIYMYYKDDGIVHFSKQEVLDIDNLQS